MFWFARSTDLPAGASDKSLRPDRNIFSDGDVFRFIQSTILPASALEIDYRE